MRGSKSDVTPVASSRDGKLILSDHSNGTVRHWDVPEKDQSLALLDKIACITRFTLSANGKLAVSGSLDKVIQNWDTSTGEAFGAP